MQHGVKLHSIDQPVDDTPAGRLVEIVFAGLAQFDNETRGERSATGMIKGLEAGRWMWAAPLGYIRNLPKTSPSLFVVEEEAEHIRYAFEQVAKGKSKADILIELQRRGLRTRKGNTLTKQSLNNILKNPRYAGIIDNMGIEIEGDFEPIVSRDLYEIVNRKKSSQRNVVHPRLNHKFPLRRFIKCVACHRPLTGSESTGRGGKKYGHYRCENKECRTVKLPRAKLNTLFEEELNTLSVRPQTLDLIEAVARDVCNERTAEEIKGKKLLQLRIEKLTQRIDSLVDANLEGKIDQETYERKKAKCDEEIKEARSLIPHESISQEQLSNAIVKTKAMLTDLKQTWNRLEIQQKVAFQQLIYPEGLCCDGEQLGTAKKSWLFIDFIDENSEENGLVRRPGLEPGTCRLRV